MSEINRKYKDRLFNFIFGSEENRAWTLSLYNAINKTNYTDPNEIQINTIKQVLYLGMHNDTSFLLRDEFNQNRLDDSARVARRFSAFLCATLRSAGGSSQWGIGTQPLRKVNSPH